MRAPATAGGKTSRKAALRSREPEIKVSRGPGTGTRTRKVVEPRRAAAAKPRVKASAKPKTRAKAPAKRGMGESDRRVAETRRQSLNSFSSGGHRPAGSTRATARSNSGGGGSVRAVAVGAGGAAAAVATVVTRPVGNAARPMLRVVSGGLERLPAAANSASPVARGRMLIMIAGLLAVGLIYISVGKLEYGDSYGGYAARSLQLQRENTVLRARIAHDSSAERIQKYAQTRGMVVPAPEQYDYLRAKRGDALKAAKGYTAPATAATPQSTQATEATGASGTLSTAIAPQDVTDPSQVAATTTTQPTGTAIGVGQ